MDTRSILRKHRSRLALVIGNGVNLYGPASNTNSWHDLLVKLAGRHLPGKFKHVPKGVSLTEFYDVLELKSPKRVQEKSLQQDFCRLMEKWQAYDHHRHIVEWARAANRPILTSNFESVLSDAGGCSLYRTMKGGFTDFYPWENYYGSGPIENPAEEFGIWHINGMQHYHRSVRLGLTHYMGSVERARGWLHKGKAQSLFFGKHAHSWRGASSWLHVIFHCPLLIFGLGLEENEVFLRWLLIERARYFRKFPDRKKDAWYVHAGEIGNDGKRFFLEGVGIQSVSVADYAAIYGEAVWT